MLFGKGNQFMIIQNKIVQFSTSKFDNQKNPELCYVWK